MHSKTFTSLLMLGLAQMVPEASAHPRLRTGRAIYMLSNNEQNNVVAVSIGRDGMLSGGTSTATGGAGSNIIVGGTNETQAPDALVSQSSLTVAGNNLFAVNAGSNTVTMFEIDRADPTKLTMVGQPVAVPGDFPNTVAVSARNRLVCVASTGAASGISCASFSERGIGQMDQLRPIYLGQTTTTAMGPPNTISQVFFSNNEKTLFASIKGNPAQNTTGVFGAFQVDGRHHATNAYVSRNGTMTSLNGTVLLFGASTIPGSDDLIVTDPTFGAAILSVDSETGAATIQSKGIIPGQAATCWAAISPVTRTAFVTDGNIDRLVEVSLTDASVVSVIDLSSNGDPGLDDLAVAGDFVYALSPGNGTTIAAVAVVNVVNKMQAQEFPLQSLGVTKNSQGMAVLL